ncbi:zinc finger ccch domain-containing protein 14 [Stylonychia lemnae]|uniref:Zinc finger ccch domain-containing protein 14 n=1 Tax=Stylonychia lemnae TaxID=5949 RepID=A0A078A2A2_STYLE|nr:zinc finger ccch domain-containing protein 14 [Stylonychia lemnae]|eukprot:CDW76331.1 zinc finger ccch domain-containing protein 14 [Stylonychia lemnae]
MPPRKQANQKAAVQTQSASASIQISDTSLLGLPNANDETMNKIKSEVSTQLSVKHNMVGADAIVEQEQCQFILELIDFHQLFIQDDVNELKYSYILTLVKEDIQRSELISQLQELFGEGTKSFVDWLFTDIAPKYSAQVAKQASLIDEFNDQNNDFNEELRQMEQQQRLSSLVGAKGESIDKKADITNIAGAGGKLMMRACQDATNSTTKVNGDKPQINQQQQAPKRIINLERDKNDIRSSNTEGNATTTGDVFDRLKKRPLGDRQSAHLDMDLESLIKKEGIKKAGYGGNNREEDIHKRIKKGHVGKPNQRPLEEVKIDPSSTLIDLNQHKNNIRLRQQEIQEQDEKKRIRCRHFPNCKNTDEECPYHHPKELCEFFPKCTFGEKCLNLHPDIECKFGLNCTRQNCSYKHPKGRALGGGMNSAALQKTLGLLMMAGMGVMGGKPKSKKYKQGQESGNPDGDVGQSNDQATVDNAEAQ